MPKDKLRIEKSFEAVILSADAATGRVQAIVNVFGIVDDATVRDIVHPGAFVKTIDERFPRIKVLDSHNADSIMNVIGKPVAIRELKRAELSLEVQKAWPMATGGLFTDTQYAIETPEGLGAFQRIAGGYVTEYSIAFNIAKGKFDYGEVELPGGEKLTVRHIREVILWEYSPVVWGANPATYTTDVKNADVEAKEMTPEGPQKRLGDVWKAQVMDTHMMICNQALSMGIISNDEHTAMCEHGMEMMSGLMEAMGEDMRNRPMGTPNGGYHGYGLTVPLETRSIVGGNGATAQQLTPAEPPAGALTEEKRQALLTDIEQLQRELLEVSDASHSDGGHRPSAEESQPTPG